MRWRLSTFLVLLFPLAPLRAQSPQDRLTLDRFRDSLAAVRDTTALRTLTRSLTRLRSADPAISLRAALAALRLAALGVDADAGRARDELRRLTKRQPGWPLAWHALAEAEVRRAGWERANPLALGNRVGTGALERAIDYERRALLADPGFAPAALSLTELAVSLHDTALYAPARDALRRVSPSDGALAADLLLARGRLERATGETDSAIAAFARAAASGERASEALARLELARTRLAAGASGEDSAYFAAAATDDSAVVAGYRADLSPIATDSQLAGFDAAAGESRAAFVRRFWTDRDQAELRRDGERLREHYRRLLYARRHFALTVWRRFYGGNDAYRSGSEELDDRGVIYVRHGEPRARLQPFVFGLMPNETWRYDRADGDLLFHFSAGYDDAGGGDLYDYRLVESVLDLHGAGDATVDELLLSRESVSPLYGRMLHWGPNGAARARGHERGIGRASIHYGTSTDTYERQFARRLTAFADLVAIGSRGGQPLAHFVFGLAPAETTPTLEADGARYAVRVSLVALDRAEHAVARSDTTLQFLLARPLAPGEYLIGRVEVPMPPGSWVWRAALEQGPDAGVVLPRDTVRVAPAPPGLSLSDLALGVRAASARWEASPGDTVLLTPFDLFVEGREIELYYEAAGVRPGTAYRHQIAVFRMRGAEDRVDQRPVVSLAFEEPASGEVIRAHRTLQLRKLKPGAYVVEVKVLESDGRTESRRRAFRVIKQERSRR
ncbi:MAG TPA: GWxTD domain-containing protein [Gemmatimonadales bacterium]|nr:GWxTD domain-containing protein [Gemmatimonadales bacterium]